MRKLYTIGFTKKSAKDLFRLLQDHGVTILADVRLNNTGQLAGYTKKQDLEYFLSLVGIGYQHWKEFAPTKPIRDTYHADHDFTRYELSYRQLLADRGAASSIPDGVFDAETVCLLCSEATPENCHRRLAAQWIASTYSEIEVVHL